jgi:hypothetical protein
MGVASIPCGERSSHRGVHGGEILELRAPSNGLADWAQTVM